MNRPLVDLRSDTVTLPSPAMRAYMMDAPVGDDVYGEDPTVNDLEQFAAELTGAEAGLFIPSGTMANQIAAFVYGGPACEILVVDQSHLFFYEAGGVAVHSGTQLYPVPCQNGVFDVDEFIRRVRQVDDHFPGTVLFWVENTHNRGGGKIVPFMRMKQLFQSANSLGIPVHVDGARIVNASVATGIPLPEWSAVCSSMSICLSKGLGAPVGSILLGTQTFIQQCRRARKLFGGGMRQAGVIAAGGVFALKNNIERLADDHRRADRLDRGLSSIETLGEQCRPDTNIVMIDLDPTHSVTALAMVDILKEEGILMNPVSKFRLRAVTHMDVDDAGIDRTVDVIQRTLGG